MEWLDVRSKLAVENGQKVIYVKCQLEEQRLLLLQTSPLRNNHNRPHFENDRLIGDDEWNLEEQRLYLEQAMLLEGAYSVSPIVITARLVIDPTQLNGASLSTLC